MYKYMSRKGPGRFAQLRLCFP